VCARLGQRQQFVVIRDADAFTTQRGIQQVFLGMHLTSPLGGQQPPVQVGIPVLVQNQQAGIGATFALGIGALVVVVVDVVTLRELGRKAFSLVDRDGTGGVPDVATQGSVEQTLHQNGFMDMNVQFIRHG